MVLETRSRSAVSMFTSASTALLAIARHSAQRDVIPILFLPMHPVSAGQGAASAYPS